jgi:hypothetical protein
MIYLSTTLDLMISNGLHQEVQNIVENSECIKIGDIIYFKLKEVC